MTVNINSNNFEQATNDLATVESLCICLADGSPLEGLEPEHSARIFELIREKTTGAMSLLVGEGAPHRDEFTNGKQKLQTT